MREAARGEVRSDLLQQGDEQMQRVLIVLGLLMLAAGLAWPWLRRIPLGRLPGDIHIVRDGFSFHFPIVSCIVVSLLVSLILWIFRR
jgi:hypothetical protein